MKYIEIAGLYCLLFPYSTQFQSSLEAAIQIFIYMMATLFSARKTESQLPADWICQERGLEGATATPGDAFMTIKCVTLQGFLL